MNHPEVEICVSNAGNTNLPEGCNIRHIACPHETSIFERYAVLIGNSRGQYVALLDAACPPADGWLDAVLSLIRDGHRLVFGPVQPGWPPEDARIVGYLAEYAQFREPLSEYLGECPGNNFVFCRDLLEQVTVGGHGFQKTFFIQQVQSQLGLSPTPCNRMRVLYLKTYPWRHYLRRRLHHGRLYGGQRSRKRPLLRIVYAIGTPVLPLLRTWRILAAVWPDPELKKAAFRFWARILGSECAWSLGELHGYLAGQPPHGRYLD